MLGDWLKREVACNPNRQSTMAQTREVSPTLISPSEANQIQTALLETLIVQHQYLKTHNENRNRIFPVRKNRTPEIAQTLTC